MKKIMNNKVSKIFNIVSMKKYEKLKKRYLKLEKNYKNLKASNEEILKDIYANNSNLFSKNYIKKSSREFERKKNDPKLIPFYLPQFHTIPENDKWWGKGFTEWTNVTQGQPQFVGHYQPHLPDELGFYDLDNTKIFKEQVSLAKKYGVYGFCFHYYWFSGGKRLLEKPIFNYLNDKSLDFPFMLCWANEPWSRRWDGSEDDILIDQKFEESDIKKFIKDIMPFLKDKRYIKVNNCPILIIYRPHFFSKDMMLKMSEIWREYGKREGFDDLYLLHTRTGGFESNSLDWGFDGELEFPPNNISYRDTLNNEKIINPNFKGRIFDLPKIVMKNFIDIQENENLYKTVLPSWDNTARKKNNGHVYYNSSPDFYKKWLSNAIKKTEKIHPDNKIVFINAWNEWAEGAHLEPDKKYGFAYLEATLDALLENRSNSSKILK
ncbi:glycoside hydrolase family 99-like domain-containing protein [Methanobrevibacter arboriphilus]|uniref:Uncharacterized protein n=1 Tax=Methanobrevibacter arboriphilus TaxID=39441 RepID=A0ACA8R3X3_METAZ|nr:glycoside hydrolase family 99-like domain-containing protein [Methanobrevibacter arboriphilus]BBL62211.1 hypothetical protein MarbSA_12510 [Methanobrevibacter arboriphilus]